MQNLTRFFTRGLGFALMAGMGGFASTVNTAMAHPGHGVAPESNGFVHYLASPQHWGMVALVAVVAVLAAVLLSGKRRTANA